MADTKRTGKAIESPQAIHDGHALLLWIIPQLDKFPRLRRYTLGERIETLGLSSLPRFRHLLGYGENRTDHGLHDRTVYVLLTLLLIAQPLMGRVGKDVKNT